MNSANITGYSFLAMGALVIASNWYYALEALVFKRSTSFGLLFGGVCASLGILFSSIPNRYFWIPLILDFTIPLVPYTLLFKRKTKDRFDPSSDQEEG